MKTRAECLEKYGSDYFIEKKIKEGFFSDKDFIAPSYINTINFKYIEIDGIYYSSIILINYFREQTDLILKELIESNYNMNISIFYEKQDSYKVIRELTYHIGDVAAEIDEKNKNRQDIDIATFTYNDAKYIRKEIQINNEELYFLYIYITVYANNLKELNYTLNRIQGILQSRGIQSRIAY